MPSDAKLWAPLVAAGVLAAGLAALALAPAPAFAPHFELIDHDDSVHPLTPAQLAAVRAMLGVGAALFAGLAALLRAKRPQVDRELAQLRTQASAVLGELRPRATISFALILLAGLLLRLALLDGPMRFDESDTFDYFASRSFFNLLTDYTAPNNHILHTVLARVSYLLFGDSPPALRLPALAAGMLVLPLTFLLARRLFDESAASLAMALAAVQPGLIAYSANARGYTLVCVFTLAVFLAASLLRRERNRFAWLIFVSAGSFGMFTIPIMLYPLSAAAVWALWSADERRRPPLLLEIATAAAVIAGASALFYAPAAVRTGIGAIVANRYVAPMSWQAATERANDFLADGWALCTDHLSAPVWLTFAAALWMGRLERDSRRLMAALLATAVAWMALQRVVPYARVFLYAAPLVCIVAAAGLRRLSPRPWLAAALACALAVHVYVGHVWFPTPAEQVYAELESAAPVLLQEAGEQTPVLAALPFSEPIRYAFLTHGRRRSQVLAPDVVSGALPPLAGQEKLIVLRPLLPSDTPGFSFGLDDPAFEGLSDRKLVFHGRFLEALRLRAAGANRRSGAASPTVARYEE